MTKIYSTLSRQILVILKRGKPLSMSEVYDSCCMSSSKEIAEQLSKLVDSGVVEKIKDSELYRFVDVQSEVKQLGIAPAH